MQRNLERELWLKVIRFAQEEAAGRVTAGIPQRTTMLRARRWLTTRTRSFILACRWAGLNDAQIDTLCKMACETAKEIPIPRSDYERQRSTHDRTRRSADPSDNSPNGPSGTEEVSGS